MMAIAVLINIVAGFGLARTLCLLHMASHFAFSMDNTSDWLSQRILTNEFAILVKL